MDILKELENFKLKELQAIKKDRKNGLPVRVNPDSYFAKEISYQTVLLKQIINDQEQIKTMLINLNNAINSSLHEKTKISTRSIEMNNADEFSELLNDFRTIFDKIKKFSLEFKVTQP